MSSLVVRDLLEGGANKRVFKHFPEKYRFEEFWGVKRKTSLVINKYKMVGCFITVSLFYGYY